MSKHSTIGIVGCGYWGRNYIRVFNQLPQSKVVGVADINSERLTEIQRDYPQLHLFQDYTALIQTCHPDALVVATQATTHYPIIRNALESGLHVLAEKPLTTKVSDAVSLADLAQATGRVLAVGHTFLYNDAIVKLKSLLTEGVLGQLYYLQATRTHLGPIREDVDAVWDLAAHDISIFNYLLNASPRSVTAVGGRYLRSDRVDVSFITLTYESGVIGNIHLSWIDSNKVRQIAAIGSRARVVVDDLNNLEKLRIYEKGISVQRSVADFGEFQYLLRDGDIVSPKLTLREPLKVQCQDFLDALHQQTLPRSTAATGVAVVSVLAAIEQSLHREGQPIEIERA